jgi:hypothetical protein
MLIIFIAPKLYVYIFLRLNRGEFKCVEIRGRVYKLIV